MAHVTRTRRVRPAADPPIVRSFESVMAVSVAAHGHDDHGGHDDDILYQETRDMRLMGFVLFLVSDVVLFSSYIFAYIYLRNSIPAWPPSVDGHQLPRLDTAFAAFNSVVLFGSG